MTRQSPPSSLFAILFLVLLSLGLVQSASPTYLVGTAIGDITGPAAEANFMGMANVMQTAHGIQLRLWSRAFVFSDLSDETRIAFVSADLAFIPGAIKESVIQKLISLFQNDTSVFGFDNVMISGTHTHSGPGGYSTETLYDVTSFGFIKENFDVIVNGISTSIYQAYQNRQQGNVLINNGTLLNTNANRSPYSYTYDPDASNYPYNVDKNMTVLRIQDASGNPIGMIDWFAVHGTSMNNTNELISGDNKGFASWFAERYFNPGKLPGHGKIVAAFAQCNEGDVSPNTRGASCPNGTACDEIHSTCDGRSQGCIAPGPGNDMTESCQIIGMNQVEMGLSLFSNASKMISGPIGFRHIFLNFSNINVSAQFSSTGIASSTCNAALGDSFAAGTTDGPGALKFVQGTNSSSTDPIWNRIGNILSEPTEEEKQCQYPKPILLNVGSIRIPEKAPWVPTVIPLQMFRLGQLYIIGVPGEFTTMSGRRLINQVRSVLVENGAADENTHIIIAGLSNEYTHYIATPQEYIVQRYEAASTLYGPQTLSAYLQEFSSIAKSLAQNTSLPAGLPPPTYNFTLALFRAWKEDKHPIGSPFGSVLENVDASYQTGNVVTVKFQGANPRNDYRTNSSFLAVDQLQNNGEWRTVLSDADWETIFHWERHLLEPHQSIITIKWLITKTTPAGSYRIRYIGNSKASDGTISEFSGTSATFAVSAAPSSAAPLVSVDFRTASLVHYHDWWLKNRKLWDFEN